jgi:hypothetical protein
MNLTHGDIARIGLTFIEGDAVEDALLDKYGPVDYDFDKFNQVRKVLGKMHKLAPDLDMVCIVWQQRPDNPEVVFPLVLCTSFPLEWWRKQKPNAFLKRAFLGEETVYERGGRCKSLYYPIRNSDERIVGALEIVCDSKYHGDI